MQKQFFENFLAIQHWPERRYWFIYKKKLILQFGFEVFILYFVISLWKSIIIFVKELIFSLEWVIRRFFAWENICRWSDKIIGNYWTDFKITDNIRWTSVSFVFISFILIDVSVLRFEYSERDSVPFSNGTQQIISCRWKRLIFFFFFCRLQNLSTVVKRFIFRQAQGVEAVRRGGNLKKNGAF